MNKYLKLSVFVILFLSIIVGFVLFFLPENGLYGRKHSIQEELEANSVNALVNNNQNALQSALVVQQALRNVAKSVNPTVVNISTNKVVQQDSSRKDFFDFFDLLPFRPRGPQKLQSLGSGFIISKNGFIVTNNHVVQDADEIRVLFFNEKEYQGKLVGHDQVTDIAVIKIDAGESLPTIPLGDSDTVGIGDFAIAIGNPFGLNGTFTLGVISAIGRDTVDLHGGFKDYIQTDASINRGNSGGPLLNIQGQAIGMNTIIYSNTGGSVGIGFAIPVNIVRRVVTSLIEKGVVERGYLGVTISPIPEDVAQHLGVEKSTGIFVNSVEKDSPADKAGMQDGDIIISLNNEKIASTSQLQRYVGFLKAGQNISVEILRNKEKLKLSVTIARRHTDENVPSLEKDDEDENKAYLQGAFLGDIETYHRYFRLNKNMKGLVVIKVESGSQAEMAGIIVGDVIQSVNYQEIHSVEDFQKYIKNNKQTFEDKGALIKINRRGHNYFVLLKSKK